MVQATRELYLDLVARKQRTGLAVPFRHVFSRAYYR
jgi:hypothetical protein